MKVCEKVLTVSNPKGVHSRVATKLINLTTEYNVRLSVKHQGHAYDCISVLDVLSLALVNGADFTVKVKGNRAAEAIVAMESLMHEREDF